MLHCNRMQKLLVSEAAQKCRNMVETEGERKLDSEERIKHLERELAELKKQMESQKLARQELMQQIDTYIEESQDEKFDLYLEYMKRELEKPESRVEEISSSLERNLAVYRKNRDKTRLAEPESRIDNQEMARQPEVLAQKQESQKNQKPFVKQQKTVEFKLGIWVLSVIGAVFILMGVVTLGKEFLSTFVQGMLLYILTLMVILVSELVLRDRLEKLSVVLTGTGIGSLYLCTVINCLYLRIIPISLAIGIALLTAVTALLISYARDSAAISIISIAGIYLSMLYYGGIILELWQFCAIAAVVWIVNLMCLFLKAKTGRTAVEIIQITGIGIYTPILMLSAYMGGIQELAVEICRVGFLILLLGVFLTMAKKKAQLWTWAAFTVMLGIGFGYAGWEAWICALLLTAAAVAGCYLVKKEDCNWVFYYAVSWCVVSNIMALLPYGVRTPVLMSLVLFLCLLFQLMKKLRMPRKQVLSWITLGIQGAASLSLAMGSGTAALICSLLAGTLAVVILTRERFGIRPAWRGLMLAGYLTYMVFCFPISQRVIESILLILVSLAAIGMGLAMKEKMARVYGLSLCLFTCLKVVLWDFWGESIFNRMLAFLVVGVLVLAVSVVYMLLEKKLDHKMKQENEDNLEL